MNSTITITVSAKPTSKKPYKRVNFEQRTRKNVDRCFKRLGYVKRWTNDGTVQYDSIYNDLPGHKFDNIYEAKGWLIAADAWKEEI